jgi:hypothetical protein
MAVRTGSNGQLRWRGTVVARVRSWSLNISKDSLETTGIGVFDRSYVSGLRGATGTAEIMYDPAEASATALFNDVLNNSSEPLSNIELVLDSAGGSQLSGSAVLTSISPSVSVGAVTSCSVGFQVSGPLTGGF